MSSPCALPTEYGTSKKGDGFCDGIINNAGCDWDGGDCCPRRPPYPPFCMNDENKLCSCRYAWNIHCFHPKGDECKCLDPSIDRESCWDV